MGGGDIACQVASCTNVARCPVFTRVLRFIKCVVRAAHTRPDDGVIKAVPPPLESSAMHAKVYLPLPATRQTLRFRLPPLWCVVKGRPRMQENLLKLRSSVIMGISLVDLQQLSVPEGLWVPAGPQSPTRSGAVVPRRGARCGLSPTDRTCPSLQVDGFFIRGTPLVTDMAVRFPVRVCALTRGERTHL